MRGPFRPASSRAWRNCDTEKRRAALAEILRLIRILPLNESAAQASAEIRVHLEKAGTGIGPLDTLIAGTALAHSAILVTHNVGKFQRVPGLNVIDWY